MRFERLFVDGYGPFEKFEISSFSPGLNLVIGENEAGKSTLLDFVRGVLYGFADGRAAGRQHLPLYGGQHGGRLWLRDEDDMLWTIERLGRNLSLASERGEEGGQTRLTQLLSHTDEHVFESIYAFGLSELEDVRRLTDDELRESILSATVLGGGRSATLALRALEVERTELTRSGRSVERHGVLTALLSRREDLEHQLNSARASAIGYAEMERHLDDQQGEITAKIDALRIKRERIERLHALEQTEQFVEQGRQHELAAAALGDLDDRERQLALREREISEALTRLDLHDRLRRDIAVLADQVHATEEEIERSCSYLGLTLAQCRNQPIDLVRRSASSRLINRHEELSRELALATERAFTARKEADLTELAVTSLEAVAPSPSPSALLESLVTLRGMLRERERKNHEIELRRSQLASAPLPVSAALLPISLILLGLLGTGITIVALTTGTRHLSPTGVLGLCVALIAMIGALFTWRTMHIRGESAHAIDGENEHQDELSQRIAAVAELLSLAALPTEAEIVQRESALRRDEERERELAAAQRRCASARADLVEREGEVAHLGAEITRIEVAAAELAEQIGISGVSDPRTLQQILDTIEAVQRNDRDRAAGSEQLLARASELAVMDNKIALLLEEFGVSMPDQADLRAFLLELSERAAKAAMFLQRQSELAGAQEQQRLQIEASLDRFDDRSKLLAELTERSPAERRGEKEQLQREIDQLNDQLDELTMARGALLAERGRREYSDEVIALATELAALDTHLESAFERWIVVTTATQLLRSTLEQFERERQPAVIARAADLFATVTEGRYRMLISREDANARRSLEVEREDGARIESTRLSTGTQQQLYLCVRLALAERSRQLPMVLDDVLVNFDPRRARNVARVLAEVAEELQLLLFSCHPSVVEVFAAVGATPHLIELPSRR